MPGCSYATTLLSWLVISVPASLPSGKVKQVLRAKAVHACEASQKQ